MTDYWSLKRSMPFSFEIFLGRLLKMLPRKRFLVTMWLPHLDGSINPQLLLQCRAKRGVLET
jgi:hypothetical protein